MGDYWWWFLVAMIPFAVWFVIRNWRARSGDVLRIVRQQEMATSAAPEHPMLTKLKSMKPNMRVALEKGKSVMSTKFVNETAGENAHPAAFTLGLILLAAGDFVLFRVLFQQYVPTAPFTLPNNFGTVTPEHLVPFVAFLTYCLQVGMFRWRPAGWWWGFLDLIISVVPGLIVGAAIVSWMGLFDFETVHTSAATRSTFATLVVFWFGFFTLLDIALHTFKFAPRTSTYAGTSAYVDKFAQRTPAYAGTGSGVAEPFIGPATPVYPKGYVVAPLLDDMELTYIPKRNVRVVSAA
jgi:hypothetical protein